MMSIIELKLNPSQRELKQFGWLLGGFVVIAGGLAYWKFDAPIAARWVWGIGAALAGMYFAAPMVRRSVFVGWMCAAYPIGWVVSHLILAVVFYLVFTPIGLIMRLAGHDPMERKLDRGALSYWSPRKQETDAKRYFRQF